MQGYNVLFQPGFDHAGISTQAAVERQLEREGTRAASSGARPSRRACGTGCTSTAAGS
jgi:valyl-tRNA synthetase